MALPPLQPRFACNLLTASTFGDEATLISGAARLTEEIRMRPIERLLPYSPQIQRLLSSVNDLSLAVSGQSDVTPQWSLAENTPVQLLKPPENSIGSIAAQVDELVPVRSSRRLNNLRAKSRQISAMEALCAAADNVSQLGLMIRSTFQKLDWFTCDERIAHLGPIFSLQKCKIPTKAGIFERLQLTCSCQSFAKDFRSFEKNNGWTPKQDVLVKRILQGSDTASHRIGKHLQNFISSQPSLAAHREKLDAGLRLGTKLQVIEEIGRSLGLGSGLALLMGYECHKVSRLTYKDFHLIKAYLENDGGRFKAIREFSLEFSSWWSGCQQRYHEIYSMFDIKYVSQITNFQGRLPQSTSSAMVSDRYDAADFSRNNSVSDLHGPRTYLPSPVNISDSNLETNIHFAGPKDFDSHAMTPFQDLRIDGGQSSIEDNGISGSSTSPGSEHWSAHAQSYLASRNTTVSEQQGNVIFPSDPNVSCKSGTDHSTPPSKSDRLAMQIHFRATTMLSLISLSIQISALTAILQTLSNKPQCMALRISGPRIERKYCYYTLDLHETALNRCN